MANTVTKESGNAAAIPTSIVPWLAVSNCVKAVDFYQSAFGTTVVYKLEMPDGGLMVARLSVDGAEFWLSEDSPENTSSKAGPGTVRMILTVSDPDSFFARALQAGATEVYPVNEEHGWRIGRMADPFGHHWEIGRPVDSD